MKQTTQLYAKGVEIGTFDNGELGTYLCLTDIAKYRNKEDPRFVIQNWMRNRNTIEFLGVWEELHNLNFNRVQFDTVKTDAGLNRFVMTPTKWIEQMNAIGIISKSGRYNGGTYAHSDIAFEFASWISPEFKLYIIKDYQRLKKDEAERKAIGWDEKRMLSKINYRIHTDAIQKHLLSDNLTQVEKSYIFADEADMLNVALFGKRAKQWRDEHPNEAKRGENIRDYSSAEELIIMINLESLNAELIAEGYSQQERFVRLRNIAQRQMESLINTKANEKLHFANPNLLPDQKK